MRLKTRHNDHALESEIKKLGPWFHNLHLPQGVQTAPDHILGDYPSFKWNVVKKHLPENLSGWNVLDVGCNAGFYSFKLAELGANVLGIDSDENYLRQAQWAQKFFSEDMQTEFRKMQVYELASLKKQFDLVLFMGVFYHLRYPLLGLDIVASKTKRLLIFQSLMMPGDVVSKDSTDYDIEQRDHFLKASWPKMAFVEDRFAGDPTNWWIPNRAGVEAMLRSAGLNIQNKLGHEIYICTPSFQFKSDAMKDAADAVEEVS
jgi:tRNA (mo5U34)-methyltransferase